MRVEDRASSKTATIENVLTLVPDDASNARSQSVVNAIVEDERWPNFVEKLWLVVVNAGGGAAGAFAFYSHYASALPILESETATVAQIVTEFFTAFEPTCPTAENTVEKLFAEGVGSLASNGANLEASLDHYVWSRIFFVGAATLVAFPFANYVSGGKADARTQFKTISRGILSIFVISFNKVTTLAWLFDDGGGHLRSLLAKPKITSTIPQLTREMRFLERSGVYPAWALKMSRQLRKDLEKRRLSDCGQAEQQRLLDEKQRELEERRVEAIERQNSLTEENNRLLQQRITGKQSANLMNGLIGLARLVGPVVGPAVAHLAGGGAGALPWRQFVINAGDDAETRGDVTMKEYLDFLARLGEEVVAEPEPAKTQTYDSTNALGKRIVHRYAAARPSRLAEKFLDTVNCWNLLGYRGGKFNSRVTEYGKHRSLGTETFKGQVSCFDDHEVLKQMVLLPNVALSYTPTSGVVGINGECTLRKFDPTSAIERKSRPDVMNDGYREAIRDVLGKLFDGWNEMKATADDGRDGKWHSGHDGSAYALYFLDDAENGQEVVVPILRHEPKKTNRMRRDGKPTMYGEYSSWLNHDNHKANVEKIDDFLNDLFTTATAYDVSREFEGVACDKNNRSSS